MTDADDISLARYWGKADPNVASGPTHHTVLGHSMDVAACAFVLVDRHPVLSGTFSSAHLPIETVAITLAAICSLHDIGKLDTRFQRKAPHVADVLRPESAGVVCGPYDHGTEGFLQVEDDELARSTLVELIGQEAVPLLRAVCGHHGVLPLRAEPNPSRSSLKRGLRREDLRARGVFMEKLSAFFLARGARLPWALSVDGALVQRLSGLCAIADWIGSNVDFFGYASGPVEMEPYWETALTHAQRACKWSGLLRAKTASPGFSTLFPGYAPRDVQTITEALDIRSPALVIIEAEMGKGKTEAALSLAARFLRHELADGLTVALPTMATSNAMFGRIEDVAPRLFEGDDIQLALAHGRARREPKFQRLVERSLEAHDPDATEASVMCARWLLNKKRILLAQVGVGTIDQALQAALIVRHQFVRMFGLSRNVVIIDEVHAYDAYMEVLLEHLLRWLGALSVPVILLSATLPSSRRAALAQAFCGEVGHPGEPADDEAAACARPYPLVSVTTNSGTDTFSSQPAPTQSTRTIELEYCARPSDEASGIVEVVDRLVEAARKGARVVWIRNTVREAQRAFGVLQARASGVEHILFHARFRGCDRSRIERTVLDRFGKECPSGGRVLVATQVVEQSLDLDFDQLQTDLAPTDLLFQRAGRLHRHVRQRHLGFEMPRMVVHGPSLDDAAALRFGPSQYVYDVGTLWIADRALRSRATLSLPDDIRPLVEETYHPASRARLLALGGAKLVEAEQKREHILAGRRASAIQCCIPSTSADPDGASALPDDDDAVQAFTRDGQSATLLPFWWDGADGRALDDSHSVEPWNLSADRDGAWRLASSLMDQTLSLPARAEVSSSPSHGDASTWDKWRKQFRRFAEDSGLGHRVVPIPLQREGSSHKGWLRFGGKPKRVLYDKALGLLMPTDKDQEQQR